MSAKAKNLTIKNEAIIQGLLQTAESKPFEKNNLSHEFEAGIDEAGRGPVLGPMVYAIAVWRKADREKLSRLGFADSKQLTEEERESLFDAMQKLKESYVTFELKVLSAEYLSNRMLQKEKYNLNYISHDTAIELIYKVLNRNINVMNVYIDTVGNPITYQDKLAAEFRGSYPRIAFTVTEKADSKFPIVSAASICAKVTRDNTLKNWQFIEKIPKPPREFGSGYPGDPNTKKWLEAAFDPVFGFPTLVRFSWKTIETELEKRGLKFNFPENEEVSSSNTQQQLFKSQPNNLHKSLLAKRLSVKESFDL